MIKILRTRSADRETQLRNVILIYKWLPISFCYTVHPSSEKLLHAVHENNQAMCREWETLKHSVLNSYLHQISAHRAQESLPEKKQKRMEDMKENKAFQARQARPTYGLTDCGSIHRAHTDVSHRGSKCQGKVNKRVHPLPRNLITAHKGKLTFLQGRLIGYTNHH